MKKKIVLSVLLAVLMIVPAFAGNNRIGVTASVPVDYSRYGSSNNLVRYYFSTAIDGATYLTDSIGVGYGVSFDFPLRGTINNTAVKGSDNNALFGRTFVPYAELLYRVRFSRVVSLELGAGASVNISRTNFTYQGVTVKLNTVRLNVAASAAAVIDLGSHFAIQAGARVGIPVMTWEWFKYQGASSKLDLKYYGLEFYPFVGAAFTF